MAEPLLPPEVRAAFAELGEEAATAWWHTPFLEHGTLSPADAWELGDLSPLRRIVESMLRWIETAD